MEQCYTSFAFFGLISREYPSGGLIATKLGLFLPLSFLISSFHTPSVVKFLVGKITPAITRHGGSGLANCLFALFAHLPGEEWGECPPMVRTDRECTAALAYNALDFYMLQQVLDSHFILFNQP
jgi:hypothetical protein